MIKLNFNGRDRTYTSIDEMVIKLKVEPLSEEQEHFITKRSSRGDTTFAAINPFASEIHGEQCLLLTDTAEALEDKVSLLRYEI